MSIFFAWADILSEKIPYFAKHLFCKTRWTDYAYKLRVQEFALVRSDRKLFSCVCISWYKHSRGWESLDSNANPPLRLGFAQLSRILPNLLVFVSGYANTENVFYCLNGERLGHARRREQGWGNSESTRFPPGPGSHKAQAQIPASTPYVDWALAPRGFSPGTVSPSS